MLLYIVLLQFMFKICFLHNLGFKTHLSFYYFALLSISTVSILASGYFISFYVRYKQSKTEGILAKKAFIGAIVAGVIGVSLGTYISFHIEKPWYSLIALISTVVITLYAYFNPKRNFLSTLLNPCVKALSILVVWWFDTPLNANEVQWEVYYKFELVAVFYIGLSVIGNIVRQIIKDIVNINYHHASKYNTIPVLLGRRRAKSAALTITIVGCIVLFSFAITFVKNKFILATIFFMGTIPELVLIYFLMNARSEKDFKNVLKVADGVYLLTVISIPLVAYYFRYVS